MNRGKPTTDLLLATTIIGANFVDLPAIIVVFMTITFSASGGSRYLIVSGVLYRVD